MAKKDKQDINPEQFNEFLTYVAQKGPPVSNLSDIFRLGKDSGPYDIYKENNPLIKSYKFTGAGFINKLLNDKTDFNLTNDDKKLIIEVGAFGDPDPRSGFKLNMSDPKIADKVEAMSMDLIEQKAKLSPAEYENYRAKSRQKLVNDFLKFKVTDTVFDNQAPKLDMSERDRSKPFGDFITKELNMQSGYGFNPEIPEFAGPETGYKYNPANNQERYKTTTTSSEVYPDIITKKDRLENFSPDEQSGYLSGPEGVYYNPETEQFLNQQKTYGPPPELQGYQYDPRLQGVLSEGVNPTYGSQFQNKNQGGLIGYAKGGQMNIKQQTQNVANQGRYGDSMLLHVNPAEVKGLAQAMPITVNPETGQPEAFLPFLAPILGGMAGSALLTGAGATAAGAGILGTAGLSSALATGIGAGLATYAETGGSGSKALMSMLTGYGGAKAAELAGGAAASSADIAANTPVLTSELSANLMNPNSVNAAGVSIYNPANVIPGVDMGILPPGLPPVNTPELSAIGNMELQKQLAGFQPALQQSGANAADAFYAGPVDGFRPDLGDSLKQAFSGDGGYPEGFGNLLTGATNTSSYLPMSIGLGGRGIMESQDAFERQNQQMILDDEERKRQMYLDNPEIQLYSASGGITQFNRGGGTDNYDSESGKQVYAPVKQQYEVNPNFMAGFAPETMYFRPDTINAPSTNTRGGSRPTLGADTYTGTKGGYDYEGSIDADGNYVAGTAQGVQFAPQTAIDPYAAFTGMTPDGLTSLLPLQGLVQSEYNPYPVQPMEMSPTDNTTNNSNAGGGDGGVGVSDDATDSDGNPLTGSPNIQYDPQAAADVREKYKDYFFDYDDIQDFYRDEVEGVMDRKTGGDTNMPNKGLEALNKVAPEVVDKMGYQEGGQTDPLIQEVTMFILGESDNEEIVNQFVNKYGVEAFTQLREQILQSLVPNAQTSGLIEGVGNGGMDDDIMGTIGNKEKIAVSQDEFIVPADVVSMLGDGSSDAGSKQLYDMMDRVRQEKTGTTKQAPKLANAGGMLPA